MRSDGATAQQCMFPPFTSSGKRVMLQKRLSIAQDRLDKLQALPAHALFIMGLLGWLLIGCCEQLLSRVLDFKVQSER